jgi:dethiobiotin synthetase
MHPRGLFVTGTDTGAGKSVLSAVLLAAMRAAGESVRAHKPAVTGLDEPIEGWPADHELLALAAGMEPEEVAPLRYGPAVSPHLAGALAGEPTNREQLLANARAAIALAAQAGQILIVEGVGGLLVPLAEDLTVLDLAREIDLPMLIAARPGLGTINHTLLTLHAARGAGLDVRAVVLTPWPEHPSALEHSNRETLARLGGVEVEVLAEVAAPERRSLATAGERLPWPRWLG